jgi:hypothetical protein
MQYGVGMLDSEGNVTVLVCDVAVSSVMRVGVWVLEQRRARLMFIDLTDTVVFKLYRLLK